MCMVIFFLIDHLPHPGVKAIDGDVHVFSLAKTSKPGNFIPLQLVANQNSRAIVDKVSCILSSIDNIRKPVQAAFLILELKQL